MNRLDHLKKERLKVVKYDYFKHILRLPYVLIIQKMLKYIFIIINSFNQQFS